MKLIISMDTDTNVFTVVILIAIFLNRNFYWCNLLIHDFV